MSKIKNFRPLALDLINSNQQKIKKEMIFRSGNLDHADEADIESLKKLGIQVIYDLRSPQERKDLSHLSDFEVKHFNLSESDRKKPLNHDFLFHLSKEEAFDFMLMLYRDHLSESKIIQPLFKDMIKEHRPFLFHCAQGKDRTGVVAAILMFLLGFDEKSVIQEYLIIDEHIINDAKLGLLEKGLLKENIEALDPLHGVDTSYINAWMDKIKQTHGTLSKYIEKWIGIDQEDIALFYSRYLED